MFAPMSRTSPHEVEVGWPVVEAVVAAEAAVEIAVEPMKASER